MLRYRQQVLTETAPQVMHFAAESEDSIVPMDHHRQLLYARGYLWMARRAPDSLPGDHWSTVPLARGYLAWDRRTPLAIARHGTSGVAVLGRAVHVEYGTSDIAAIAVRLLAHRRQSRESYLLALDHLAGRYVIIDYDDEGARIQTDTTGMRSAYYSPSGGLVASHSHLVADHLERPSPSVFARDGWMGRTKAFTFPGRMTQWEDVFLLTPNLELDLHSGQLSRVFPRSAPEVLSAADIAAQVLPMLQRQLRLCAKTHEGIGISLSGGLDSRVTLALSRPFTDICRYFTYHRTYLPPKRETTQDLRISRQLAEGLGLSHQVLQVDAELESGPLKTILVRNSSRGHGRSIAAAYRRELPSGLLHFRSNLYEIGRSFYRKDRRTLALVDAQVMAGILTAGRGIYPEAVRGFEDYIEVSRFGEVEGFDPLDLFYWEHRMGAWHNAVLIESDIAFDSHSLVNCRAVLGLLLSAPIEDRINAAVFDHLVGISWPDVYKYEVNGQLRAVPALYGNVMPK